jgi:hypothetical protein
MSACKMPRKTPIQRLVLSASQRLVVHYRVSFTTPTDNGGSATVMR